MFIKIKQHLLFMAIALLAGFLLGNYFISQYQNAQIHQLFSSIQQTENQMQQFADGLALLQISQQDYSYIAWLCALVCGGIVNGFVLASAYLNQHREKRIRLLVIGILACPLIIIAGILTIIPLTAYELYSWLFKDRSRLYFFMKAEVIKQIEASYHFDFHDEKQKQLLVRYMDIRRRNLFLYFVILLPVLTMLVLFWVRSDHTWTELIIFFILVTLTFFISSIVFTLRQRQNVELMNTYLASYDTQLLEESYRYLLSRCTYAGLNVIERSIYLNAMLLNGSYERLQETMNKLRLPKRLPVCLMSERKLAEIDRKDEAFHHYGNKLRTYYQKLLKRNPKQCEYVQNGMLDLAIRDDLYAKEYTAALEKVQEKTISQERMKKAAYHYQMGICLYHLGRIEEALPHLQIVDEIGGTYFVRKEIQPLLNDLKKGDEEK